MYSFIERFLYYKTTYSQRDREELREIEEGKRRERDGNDTSSSRDSKLISITNASSSSESCLNNSYLICLIVFGNLTKCSIAILLIFGSKSVLVDGM
jgi:hypothetical protein